MRNLVHIPLATALFFVGASTLHAEDPTPSASPEAATHRVGAVLLKSEYVATVKSAAFLDGDKLSGWFLGFDNDFAKFKDKNIREEVYVPKSADLYMLVPARLY